MKIEQLPIIRTHTIRFVSDESHEIDDLDLQKEKDGSIIVVINESFRKNESIQVIEEKIPRKYKTRKSKKTKKVKEKKIPNVSGSRYSDKDCENCGITFTPRGANSRFCDNCSPRKKKDEDKKKELGLKIDETTQK